MSNAAELFSLQGQVAMVTGASSGLGRRFAKVLAAHGARVVLAARRADRLEALKNEIIAAGGEALAVSLDVADRLTIAPAFNEAESAFGTVTLLANNAGMAVRDYALDTSPEDWRRIMDVNLDGVFFMAQEAAKRMVAAGTGGSIINIASILGLRVANTMTAYAVTKSAVIQLTKSMALELAPNNIRVNAIAPGYILTEINKEFFDTDQGKAMIKMIPQQRIGKPSDLDGTLLLLASDKASGFMTGSVLTIDGGHILPISR
ncbi:MAG: glucose 1-dehydrogenase [Fimbriimonadaceae bacterium]|nr:glucose 1-dehydrogenase [Alphaproteobacteria bacterium]